VAEDRCHQRNNRANRMPLVSLDMQSGLPVIAATTSGAAGKLNQEDGIVKPSGVTGGKIRRALARFNLLPAISIRYVNNGSKADSCFFHCLLRQSHQHVTETMRICIYELGRTRD
jgi:hypothetical protein